jgi:glycosyltransferase involved in cell wall biosynthesis
MHWEVLSCVLHELVMIQETGKGMSLFYHSEEKPQIEAVNGAGDAIISVTVIVPAFNEQESIGLVLTSLNQALETSGLLYEIIVVDDGSTDNTAQVVSQFPVRLIRHSANKGYGAALKTGVRAATHDIIITMDSDGQHNPADIPRFVKLMETHDIVIGARTKQSHAPLLRRPGKWFLGAVANYLAGMRIPDYNSGFRAFRRELFMRFAHFLPNGFSFSTTLTLAAIKEGYDIAWPPITVSPRVGTSTVNLVKDGYNILLLILRTIVLFDPLKVFLPPSLALGLFGIMFSTYGLIRFRAFPESGVLLIVAAIFLFFFGILADQISALRRGLGQ